MLQFRFLIGLVTREPERRAVTQREIDYALAMVGRAFPDGFTTIQARGEWRGVSEPSLIVEAYAREDKRSLALGLAEAIAEALEQECVALAISRPSEFLLIGDGGAL